MSIDVVPPMTIGQACSCIRVLQQKLKDLQQLRNLHSNLPTVEEIKHLDIDESNLASVRAEETPVDVEPTKIDEIDESRRSIAEDVSDDEHETLTEQPCDLSDKSSPTKQLSTSSEDDTIESLMYKLELLDSLSNIAEKKSTDSSIA